MGLSPGLFPAFFFARCPRLCRETRASLACFVWKLHLITSDAIRGGAVRKAQAGSVEWW